MISLVTIIIPSFNRQDYIADTLNSLLKQTLAEWECIIVDDGSTDNSEEIINSYIKKDTRFSFYHRPDSMKKGANSCRNFGFLKANGDYIKFLDSDDLLVSDCLEKQVEILNSNPNIQVCFSYGRYFDNDIKDLKEFWSRNKDYSDFLLGHITNQIRWQTADPLWRSSFFEYPPFREGLMNSQEWLMHGQALLKLNPNNIYNLKETFTLIRRGNERMSSEKSSSYYKNQRKARLLLIIDILKSKKRLKLIIELLKQIVVFRYWEFVYYLK